MQQQAAVISDIGAVNWKKAILDHLFQQFTDEIWAKLGLPNKEAGLPYGFNAPVNTALGMVGGDAIAGGTKSLRKAFDEGIGRLENL